MCHLRTRREHGKPSQPFQRQDSQKVQHKPADQESQRREKERLHPLRQDDVQITIAIITKNIKKKFRPAGIFL